MRACARSLSLSSARKLNTKVYVGAQMRARVRVRMNFMIVHIRFLAVFIST